MKLLLISASLIEAQQLIEELCLEKQTDSLYNNDNKSICLLITGVGIPACIISILNSVNLNEYDLLINIGIAGSSNPNSKLGTIYNIKTDYFGDIGICSNGSFENIFTLDWNNMYSHYFENGKLINDSKGSNYFSSLEQMNGVTVNISEQKLYDEVLVESMEGAAFMLLAKMKNKNFIQIRGISNIIDINRNKEAWDINTPINNYSKLIVEFVNNYK